jgi:dCTP deaminase
MMLADWQIEELARSGMICPFINNQVRTGVSYGLTSAGYDMRLASEFKMIVPRAGDILDPKNPNACNWTLFNEPDYCDIPAHGFVLARSVERWNIPSNIVGTVVGKSTYARLAIHANITPLEPGWCGYLTLEITNNAGIPARIYVGEGIAQAQFSEIEPPRVTYGERGGKYQNQGPTPINAKM